MSHLNHDIMIDLTTLMTYVIACLTIMYIYGISGVIAIEEYCLLRFRFVREYLTYGTSFMDFVVSFVYFCGQRLSVHNTMVVLRDNLG